jgi:predicted acylesterase/phospholipase RssA
MLEAAKGLIRGIDVGCRLSILLVLSVAVLSGGCASMIERTPIPTALAAETAQVPNIKGSRFWADEAPRDVQATYKEHMEGAPELFASAPQVNGRKQVQILALSGGGSDGAFGAGVLTGWTARGDRPEFEQVTGVSAGAITAPFAFLGSEYDHQIKDIWTRYNTEQLVVPQVLNGLFGGESIADTSPLKALVAQYIDREFVKKIAAEYERGRLLTIGTTNLDAKRPVVWNMGAIARHYDNPEAVQLFRDVIMASAAIPGLFPPVRIKVRADGKLYDEMHVDGGVTRQIYVNSVNLPFKEFDKLYKKPPQRYLYLVHNGKMDPNYGAVKPSTFDIASQSIFALMLYQHKGDSYRIYRMAKDAGADFNSIAVPPSFTLQPKEKFDLTYQRALFDEGFRMGKTKSWSKAPDDLPGSSYSPDQPSRKPAVPAPAPGKPDPAQPVALQKVSRADAPALSR